MRKKEVVLWLETNNYTEIEKGIFARASFLQDRCLCRFVLGRKTLSYEVHIDGKWVFTESSDIKELYINGKGQLAGMKIALFAPHNYTLLGVSKWN